MKFMSFDQPNISVSMESDMCIEYPLLHCIYSSLKASSCMDVRASKACDGKLSFDDVCKLFILVNVDGLSSKHVTDMYTTSLLCKDTTLLTTAIISALADMRQPASAYIATFKYVFSIIKVDSEKMELLIAAHRHSNSASKDIWVVKQESSKKTRVSLRDILKKHNGLTMTSASHGGQLDSEHTGATTTLESFCNMIRFPNRMSRVLRLRCYLLASLCHLFDFSMHTHLLVSGSIMESMNSNGVRHPDPVSLCAAINTLVLSQAPFQELVSFRYKCHSAFAYNHWKTLSLTQYLHLYVCAYQHKDIWKACWKHFFPVMSTQIAKEVEVFVSATEFATSSILMILRTSSPFSA